MDAMWLLGFGRTSLCDSHVSHTVARQEVSVEGGILDAVITEGLSKYEITSQL